MTPEPKDVQPSMPDLTDADYALLALLVLEIGVSSEFSVDQYLRLDMAGMAQCLYSGSDADIPWGAVATDAGRALVARMMAAGRDDGGCGDCPNKTKHYDLFCGECKRFYADLKVKP
jgi:hypothetical protein